MLEDTNFWILLSFLSFIALVGKKAYLFATKALDDYREDIVQQFAEAEALRDEAQKMRQQLALRAKQIRAEITALKENTALTLETQRQIQEKALEEKAKKAEKDYTEQVAFITAAFKARLVEEGAEVLLSAARSSPPASWDPKQIPWEELKRALQC
ncbi:MAG: hypothetical protein LBF76_02430 [Holosporales bacterium]|jgi:F0F1-type ATP synthase membrane subunit b/b'|nr:hypothetical protein [Holosporales bacterium]